MADLQYLQSEKAMPLMTLPVRSTIVQLKNARILISPGSNLTEEQLTSAGAITDLVAPSLLHCAGIPKALRIFPKARVWAPPGADGKKNFPWTDALLQDNWIYRDELALLPVEGMPTFQEHLFFHKASRTLIVTDLAFNIGKPKGIGSWLILNLFGTYKRFAVSKLFLSGVKDRKAFEDSMTATFLHDFDRVVPSHGEIAEEGKQKLRESLRARGFDI